uniref:GST N-terminal domain-containing protein n=1 Tax=Oryza punctata TaxID=4537 RepID=A0A0E0L9L4_ORYPU
MAMTTAEAAAAAPQPKEVKLYGAWGSAHAAMAQNALELKGVRYEYVEEDLERKSETLLLRLNPAHAGKVPVLVVGDGGGGRPLAESLVILEYVDEVWPQAPRLMPSSPRSRAAARFWARFFHGDVSPLSRAAVLAPTPEERAEAVREMKARMAVMEAGFERDFRSVVGAGDEGGGGPFVHGATPGLLDVILGSCAAGTRAISAMAGEEVVEPDTLPRVHASMAAFDELVAGFGTSVPHELLLARLLEREERRRAAASASVSA